MVFNPDTTQLSLGIMKTTQYVILWGFLAISRIVLSHLYCLWHSELSFSLTTEFTTWGFYFHLLRSFSFIVLSSRFYQAVWSWLRQCDIDLTLCKVLRPSSHDLKVSWFPQLSDIFETNSSQNRKVLITELLANCTSCPFNKTNKSVMWTE